MSEKTKKRKYLNQVCPDCGSKSLEIITHIIIKDGVKYSEDRIECYECEYSEKIHISSKRFHDEFKQKWA